ncbi:MAG: septation protein SepH [Actinomycetota bacterium]|nr:septation protein SepH [Actinomycetota bacterium]
MRELYVVAVSEDGRHVELAASKGAAKGSHRVKLDARLVSAVRGDLGTHTADLSPKEIQARLRAGESVEKIATSAGMAVTRVERFAGPVTGEMARMIDEARDAHVVRGRLGRSAVPLGKAVDRMLAEHAKPDSDVWTTYREDDGRWRVQVAWVGRGRAKTAAWFYEPHNKVLEAVDAASGALGHVDANPQAPRRTPKRATPAAPAKKAPAKKAPAKKAAANKAPTKRAGKPAAAKKAPAKAAAVKKAAKKAPAKAAAVKKPVAKRPTTAKKPVPKPVATKPVAKKSAAKQAPKSRPVVKARRLQVVPDPPAKKLSAKPTPKAAPKPTVADQREGVKSRASVPAWADVLLGTTPSNDQ